MNHGRQYALNVAAQLVGRSASLIAGITVSVVIARVDGSEVLGRYAWIMTFLALFVTLSDLGTTGLFSADIARAEGVERARRFGSFLRFRLALVLAVVPIALVTGSWLRPELAAALAIGTLGLPLLGSRFFDPVFQVQERPSHSALSNGFYGATLLALGSAAAWTSASLALQTGAFVLANGVYAACALWLAWRALPPRFEVDRERRGADRARLRRALPVATGALFALLNTRAGMLLLPALAGDAALGRYSATFRLLELAALLAAITTGPLLPIFAARAESDLEGLRNAYRLVSELIGIGVVPLAVVTPWLSVPLLGALWGADFVAAAPALNLLAWAAVLTFYAQLGSALLVTVFDLSSGYWNAPLAATLNIALNLALVPRLGITGVALAAVASELSMTIVCQAFVRRNLGNVFRLRRWARIGLANAALLGVLLLLDGSLAAPLDVALGLSVYAALCWSLGLLSRRELGGLPMLHRPSAGPGAA